MKKLYTLITVGLIGTASANAQCLIWENPTDSTGWNDFTSTFEGAPCDPGGGCPVNEITDFQIWAGEAYWMDNVMEGGTYTFSACNGVGGTAWVISYTVLSPSGNVDNFGLDAGSVCAITFTASESGNYRIIVTEEGACGTTTNTDTDNGFPAMTCASSFHTACGATIGITEIQVADGDVIASPNPSTGLFTVHTSGKVTELAVFDANGRLVRNENVISTVAGQYFVDLSSCENGAYMLRTTVDGVRLSNRLVVTH